MKSLLTLVLCIMLQLAANAQYNPKDYDIFKGKTEIAFHDNFDDDRNNWLVPDTTITNNTDSEEYNSDNNTIAGGVLRIATTAAKQNSFEGYELTIDINTNRNFEIEIKAKIISKKDNRGTGVIYWGREINTINGYNLYFKQNGEIDLFYSNSAYKDSVHPKTLRKKKVKSTYSTDDFNTYTIRKYRDRYYLFINGVYFRTYKAIITNGNVIGLGGSFNAVTLFDDITITNLP